LTQKGVRRADADVTQPFSGKEANMRNLIGVALGSLAVGATVTALSLGARPRTQMPGRYLTQAGTVVACEPGQRVVVRPTAVAPDGDLVECITPVAAGLYGETALYPAAPYGSGYGDMRIVRATSPLVEPAPVVERQVVYREAPVRRVRSPRSWQKSALIIGGSAGAGAGIGAAVGGKKGALIGAAIGGGAATVYDQATRR
jgi:hypothetical protein